MGTRRLKYHLPEIPGILNSPHTSVQRNGLVEGYTCTYAIIADDPLHDLSHISKGANGRLLRKIMGSRSN